MVIQTPVGGISRSLSFQQQPPFTCYDALNILPVETGTGRTRLGTRPGTQHLPAADRPGTADVRLLHPMIIRDGSGTKRILVASSGGNIQTMNGGGSTWDAISTTLSLDSNNPISAAPFGDKLYIADPGATIGTDGQNGAVIRRGSDGGNIGDQFDSPSNSDWTASPAVSTSHVVKIVGGINAGRYTISAVSADKITLGSVPTDDLAGMTWIVEDEADQTKFYANSVTSYTGVAGDYYLRITEGDNSGDYKVTAINGSQLTITPTPTDSDLADTDDLNYFLVRSVKVFDAVAGTLTRHDAAASQGNVPHGCTLAATWQDRLILAGDPVSPHMWYMSASGDYDNWLYGEEQAGAAIAGNFFYGGDIGEPIKCIIPHNRECLLIGGTDSFFVIRGDPNTSGSYIEKLSDQVGPLGQFSWTKDPNDYTYMMTRDGMYVMEPGCGSPPQSLSRERLPDEFLFKVATTDNIHLEYDTRWRAIIIAVVGSGSKDYWWFDLQNKGFWKINWDSVNPLIFADWTPAAGDDTSALVFGDEDGWISQFDRTATQDDSNMSTDDFDWYIDIGPIKISASRFHKGGITMIQAQHTGDKPDLTVRTGRDSEAAATKLPSDDYMEYTEASWDPDDFTTNPRVSGHAAIIRLEKSADATSARTIIDEMHLAVREMGRQR